MTSTKDSVDDGDHFDGHAVVADDDDDDDDAWRQDQATLPGHLAT